MYCQPWARARPGKAQLRAREDRQLQTSPAAAKTVAQAAGLAAIDQVCRLSDKARCDPPNKTYQGLPPLPVPSPRAQSSGSSSIMNSSNIMALLRTTRRSVEWCRHVAILL